MRGVTHENKPERKTQNIICFRLFKCRLNKFAIKKEAHLIHLILLIVIINQCIKFNVLFKLVKKNYLRSPAYYIK